MNLPEPFAFSLSPTLFFTLSLPHTQSVADPFSLSLSLAQASAAGALWNLAANEQVMTEARDSDGWRKPISAAYK